MKFSLFLIWTNIKTSNGKIILCEIVTHSLKWSCDFLKFGKNDVNETKRLNRLPINQLFWGWTLCSKILLLAIQKMWTVKK
jgi:hypothetical protein